MAGAEFLRCVLVTRPEPGASETALGAAALGFSPVVLPLSEIRDLPVDSAAIPKDPDAVAATSANTLRHAPPDFLARLAETPCYVVGGKTAQAARQAGFARVIEGPGDAAGLAGLMAKDLGGAGSVIYLCGRVRLPGFEKQLAAVGMSVAAVETYDTVETDVLSGNDFTGHIDIALLHSALGAQALTKIARRPAFRHLFADTVFLCLSERIAAVLTERGFTKIGIAAEPTEQALLFLLAEQS